MKKLLVEFLGTFFLVLTALITGNPLAMGIILMAWIYIGSSISGGHFNPAVSFAMALQGRLSWQKWIWYLGAQVAGATGAYALSECYSRGFVFPTPAPDVDLIHAGVFEALLAFVFTLVILVITSAPQYRPTHIFGMVIGLTLFALVSLGAAITGGIFNPAITLGSLVMGLITQMDVIWPVVLMYLGGAYAGAAVAVYTYQFLMPSFERP